MPRIYTFVIGHPLITIAQSTHRVLLVQFGESSRELLHSFGFKQGDTLVGIALVSRHWRIMTSLFQVVSCKCGDGCLLM